MIPLFWLFLGLIAFWALFECVVPRKRKETPPAATPAKSDLDAMLRIATMLKTVRDRRAKTAE